MLFSSILNSRISTVFCGCGNTIHLDLFAFIDNLFNFNYNDIIIVSPYTYKSTISVVSTANNKNNISLHYKIIHIYNLNNSGPSIDPCETPDFILSKLETVSSSVTFCCL